jgi:pyruvate dehydrogenase E2 component (dihydrolipoamide acetyltransferase)
LPALGESVTEGTVTRWLKAIGDSVAADEALLEVSTDKVDTEIPSPVAGVLLEITVAEDGVAQVGGQLGTIGALSGATPAAAPRSSSCTSPCFEPCFCSCFCSCFRSSVIASDDGFGASRLRRQR